MNFPPKTVRGSRAAWFAAALLCCNLTALAQNSSTTETGSVDSTSPIGNGNAVRDMAISGNTVVVGLDSGVLNNERTGYAEIFDLVNGEWVLQTRLDHPSPSSFISLNYFGGSVAIDGDKLLIGGTGAQAPRGMVYVYERSGGIWSLSDEILPPQVNLGGNFTFASDIELCGGIAIIGGDGVRLDPTDSPRHAVRIYEDTPSGFVLVQTLLETNPPQVPAVTSYGLQIDLDGDRVAIVAGARKVELLERSPSGWVLDQTLTINPTGATGSTSIRDLVLQGDLLVLGDQWGNESKGEVRMYRLGTLGWTLEDQVTPSFATTFSNSGKRLALSDNQLAVSTPESFFSEGDVGRVTLYDYRGGEWQEGTDLIPSDGPGLPSVGLNPMVFHEASNELLVGSFGQRVAYRFDLDEVPQSFCYGDGGDSPGCTNCPCGNNAAIGSGGGCLNSNGTSARMLASGTPSVSNDSQSFELRNATPSTFAVLISGIFQAPNNPSSPCFGTGGGLQSVALSGLRCVVQGTQRHGSRAIDVNGSIGETTSGWGGASSNLLAQSAMVTGQTRHYQAYYRENPSGTCTTGQNTSQGISIVARP